MRKTTRDAIVGIGTAAVLLGAVVAGASTLVATSAEPAAVVVTDEPIVVPTDAPNGLAAEQEADAAAAEAARLAAEAEAARVAAEQAAAAEAARIAAEQAAAEAESFDEPVADEPPTPEAPVDYCPEGYIDDPNKGCHSPICAVLEDGTQVPCE